MGGRLLRIVPVRSHPECAARDQGHPWIGNSSWNMGMTGGAKLRGGGGTHDALSPGQEAKRPSAELAAGPVRVTCGAAASGRYAESERCTGRLALMLRPRQRRGRQFPKCHPVGSGKPAGLGEPKSPGHLCNTYRPRRGIDEGGPRASKPVQAHIGGRAHAQNLVAANAQRAVRTLSPRRDRRQG